MADVDAAAPASAKSPNVKKTSSKPKKPAVHPPFAVMTVEAVKGLKERTGSSRQAIVKFVCANYTVDPALAQARVRMALKKLVEAKKLVPGGLPGKKGAGSYKLAAEMKPKVAKKTLAKKPAAKKAKTPVKKAAAKAKKTVTKKPAAKTDKAKSANTKAEMQKSDKPKDGKAKKAAQQKTAKLVAAAKVKASKTK